MSKLTLDEAEAIVAYQSTWPLVKLRKHQRLVERQLEKIAQADAVALSNLQIRQRLLDRAVVYREFEKEDLP